MIAQHFGKFLAVVIVIVLASLPISTVSSTSEKLTVEEIITRHLASIGTPEARSAVKTRVASGKCAESAPAGARDCPPLFLSEGTSQRLFTVHRQFAFDGQKSYMNSRQVPGVPANPDFPDLDDAFKAGLVGGTLSTGWALLVPGPEKLEIKYEGMRSPSKRWEEAHCGAFRTMQDEHKTLHELTVRIRQGTSHLTASLYFEPDTFRHAQTHYHLRESLSKGMLTNAMLREVFSNFREIDGLTLPYSWSLEYSSCQESAQSPSPVAPVAPYQSPVPTPLGQTPPSYSDVHPASPPRISSTSQTSGPGWAYNVEFSIVQHNRKLDPKYFALK